MTIDEWINTFSPEYLEHEKPMQDLVPDGGMVGIFREIGCIGDSLSSGEFESTNTDLTFGYHDLFDYSWGQYLARLCGSTVRNFSRGGMTASEYCESFGEAMGFWDPALACQAYIIAMGCNDLFGRHQEVGTIADVHEDWHKNSLTFAGYMGQLISRYKQIRPDAVFFLMTFPRGLRTDDSAEKTMLADQHAKLMYDLAAHFENTYVLDFRAWAPVYDEAFVRNFFVGGHMNAAGYLVTAKLAASGIDYIIRHHMDDFAQCGFIGTNYRYDAGLRDKILASRAQQQ